MKLTIEQKRERQRVYTCLWRLRHPDRAREAAIKQNERAKKVRRFYREMSSDQKNNNNK